MHAGHLIDALSASLFALLGIWAAVVRRHWFVRFAVVGGVLGLALLIPAYEVVIQFGVAMGLIAGAVGATRRPREWRARWSVETSLLAMVVAAAVAAVIGAAPTYSAAGWVRLLGIGLMVSYFGLACLWIVCGRTRVGVRLAGGLAAIALFVVAIYMSQWLFDAALRMSTSSGSGAFRRSASTWLQWDRFTIWLRSFLPTVGLGVGTLLTAIALARASGWFSRGDAVARRWIQVAARSLLCLMMIAALTPNLALLYRLITPPELPEVVLPTPNGYDDFVAAGRLAPDDLLTPLRAVHSMNYPQLRALYEELAGVDAFVEIGLAKECRVRDPFADVASQDFGDMEAIMGASVALMLRSCYLRKYAPTDEYVAYLMKMLRFQHESNRGGGFEMWTQYSSVGIAAWHIQERLGDLDARGCRLVALALAEVERRREPLDDKREVQYLIDQHSDWETHARAVLTQWAGAELYPLHYFNSASLAEFRLAMVDAALQAYWLEIGQAPDSLAALTPEYLPEIPLDPFSNEPLRYRRTGATYVVYCVGKDGDDDGGVPEVHPGGDGDIVAIGPHKTPLVERLKRLAYRCEALSWEWIVPLVQPMP